MLIFLLCWQGENVLTISSMSALIFAQKTDPLTSLVVYTFQHLDGHSEADSELLTEVIWV